MTYNFLFIALLTLIPGVFIYLKRSDLRPVIHIMSLASIPFAFTEWLFYPDYWEPVFLFNLVEYIGFGVEDIIFVMGLGAFSSTLYAAVCKQVYISRGQVSKRQLVQNISLVFALTLFLIILVTLLQIPMIYGSVGIMLLLALAILVKRSDLLLPAVYGGLLTTLVYTGLCFIILLVEPDIFDLTWHTEKFINVFILGIPLEEILYSWSAGTLATIIYPTLFKMDFSSIASEAQHNE